jgi:ubiquilin
MELARNPAAFQELMRTQDRALSNLESIPGGYNALQRMYRDIQEPMLNAVQERLTGNPFAELLQNNGAPNPQQGVENRDPLPNPWAAPTTGGGSAAPTSNPSSTPGSGGTAAGQTGANPAGGAAGMMQQMMQNMGGMQNLLNTPYTQNLLDSLLSNPDLAQQMMGANPLFANNPQMQEQLRAMTPTLLNQLRDPEFQQVLSNPAALQAIMQIQQGIEQLRVAAPGFANRYTYYVTFVLLCLRVVLQFVTLVDFGRMGFGNMPGMFGAAASAAAGAGAGTTTTPSAPPSSDSTGAANPATGTDSTTTTNTTGSAQPTSGNTSSSTTTPNPFAGLTGVPGLNRDALNEFMATMVRRRILSSKTSYGTNVFLFKFCVAE